MSFRFATRYYVSRRQCRFSSLSIKSDLPTIIPFQSLFTAKYTRTCLANEISNFLDKPIRLCGWITHVRFINPKHIFVVLRDHSGPVQLLLKADTTKDYNQVCARLDEGVLESIIAVKGIVLRRPPSMINPVMANGEHEISVSDLQFLNKAEALPFNPNHENNLPEEELRLSHRFLDLRRPTLQGNLRLRSQVNKAIRDFMESQSFTEIETPILFKSTPEGAREFLVPANRVKPHANYALTQSPQQFKQMLMAAGFDRYYQIAKCFRDEDLRSDRQPEFMQLDMEMSFVTTENVMNMMEGLVKHLWKTILGKALTTSFPRMTYHEALSKYGSDKPDIRYPFTIRAISTDGTSVTEAFELGDIILQTISEEELLSILGPFKSEIAISGPIQLAHSLRLPLFTNVGLVPAIIATRRLDDHVGCTILGKIRTNIVRALETKKIFQNYQPPSELAFLWVYDFPLLVKANQDDNQLTGKPTREYKSMHHPFTAPHPNDLHLLASDPLAVRGEHYDLVLNGNEIGGGSVRIHSADLQEFILREIIRLPDAYVRHFQHLLKALRSGCPPHGGMALGLDRIVALMCGANSIRDVIAFPKNSQGIDPCVDAPS